MYKQAGLYEIEFIDNINTITIAINPEVYFETLKEKSNKNINKKDEDLRKDVCGMDLKVMKIMQTE